MSKLEEINYMNITEVLEKHRLSNENTSILFIGNSCDGTKRAIQRWFEKYSKKYTLGSQYQKKRFASGKTCGSTKYERSQMNKIGMAFFDGTEIVSSPHADEIAEYVTSIIRLRKAKGFNLLADNFTKTKLIVGYFDSDTKPLGEDGQKYFEYVYTVNEPTPGEILPDFYQDLKDRAYPLESPRGCFATLATQQISEDAKKQLKLLEHIIKDGGLKFAYIKPMQFWQLLLKSRSSKDLIETSTRMYGKNCGGMFQEIFFNYNEFKDI